LEDFIYSKNISFFLNDIPFRFIGCNMYELANVNRRTASLMIKDAYDEGFKAIRFWAFEPVSKYKVEEICNLASDYEMKVIPVLADPNGYLQNYKINSDWYKSDYKKSYLNHVSEITSHLKNKNEILLWEMINEPSTKNFEDMFVFSKTVSEQIKASDPNHLISLGTVGGIGDSFGGFFSRFSASNFEKLYSIKTIDAVSLHDYSFSATLLERLDMFNRLKGNPGLSKFTGLINNILEYIPLLLDKFTLNKYKTTMNFPLTIRNVWRAYNKKNLTSAIKLDKPVYIGETGFKKNLGAFRKKILEIELNNYFIEGISGVLLWSFESQGCSNDGHDYGFNLRDEFGSVIKKINSSLQINSSNSL